MGSRPRHAPSTALAAQSSIPNKAIKAAAAATPSLAPASPGETAVSNQLFFTAEIFWDQPVPEQAFARFHDWATRYEEASVPSERARLEMEGVELARERRATLRELIQSDPERALELTPPLRVLNKLPASVASLLETRVSGRGQLAVMGALPEAGKESQVVPTFRTASIGGADYKAFVYGRRLGQPTRDRIPLNGIVVDKLMAVSEHPLRILERAEVAAAKARTPDPVCAVSGLSSTVIGQETAADVGGEVIFLCRGEHARDLNARLTAAESGGPDGGGETGATSDPAASTWTEGLKRVLLIRVDFPDLTGVSLTDSGGATLVTNLHAFYDEMSYGRAGFTAIGSGSDITPIFRMTNSASWYGTNDYYNPLRAEARAAATAAGYVLSNYDRDVICMGSVPGFGWSGLAYVGAAGAWLRNSFGTGVAGHELGHNWGLNHANFWDTSGASIIGPGTSIEYGDIFDTMGSASAGNNHFNARYKVYLNWLTTNEWATATTSGTYRIYSHDNRNSPGIRGLRVVKSSSTNYWVEFRQKFTSNKWLMNGAGLRTAQNGNERSLLLDTTPGTYDAKNDSALIIGRTFNDSASGIHITPIGKGNTTPESLDVVVNLGTFPGNVAPSVTLSASTTNGATGAVLGFSAAATDANGDALAYYWDFGDGNFGTNGPTASKSWAASGEYLVRCVVTDMKGGEASDSQIIVIGSPTTYRISGTVSATNGPLQGARVSVSSTRITYTDSDGTYNLVGLPAATYTVSAILPDYAFTPVGFTNPIIVAPNAAGVDFLATYTTVTPPTITGQPQSLTVSLGTTATFTVGATGTMPLGYQWRFNGANISGATSSSYSKGNLQATNAGNYSVVVSNLAGTVASANAVLTVNTPPGITSQPQNQTVIAGNDAVFSVTASGGTPLYYQWRFNGVNIAGATASSLTRSNAQMADAGSYRVVITNGLGAITSAPASLTVNFTIAASATYGGTVTKTPNQASYPANSVVTLSASPVSVFLFTGWSGNASGTNNPLTIQLTSNLVITANFTSPVADLIVDNPAASFSGSWTTDASAGDKYAADYRTTASSANVASASATFTPNIVTGGRYDVYTWFPTINKGMPVTPFVLTDADGTTNITVNQSSGSGGWELLAAGRNFSAGTNGNVRLTNVGQGGKTVAADAVRWVYSESQAALNNPPTIAPVSLRTIHAGATLIVTNFASDTDLPAQTLTFALLSGAPGGATIGSASGVLTWSTTALQAPGTNSISVRVSDNGTPSLSATNTIQVRVVEPLSVVSIKSSAGTVTLQWNAIPGQTYRVQYANQPNAAQWYSLTSDVVAAGPVASKSDVISAPGRLYRLLLVP